MLAARCLSGLSRSSSWKALRPTMAGLRRFCSQPRGTCGRRESKKERAAESNVVGLLALPLELPQALNNAQATHAGFGFISSENVFKVWKHTHQGARVRGILQGARRRTVVWGGPHARVMSDPRGRSDRHPSIFTRPLLRCRFAINRTRFWSKRRSVRV